jgi:phosphate:Na+ symporter
MSLAYSHFVTPAAALALVLGANLGSAVNPLLEGTSSADPASRRVPLGNLLNRVIGVGVTLPFVQPLADLLSHLDPNAARMTANFHTIFNVVLALIFVFLLDGVASLLRWFLPDAPKRADAAAPLYLNETAIQTPSVALSCAARETLHMGDAVEDMLRKAMTALMTNDRKLAAEVSRMDNI